MDGNGDASNGGAEWKLLGHTVPKGQVVYFCQVFIIIIVIISCIINLSLQNGNSEMWVSFFGYSFGAMLPPPKIKKAITGMYSNAAKRQDSASL